jgi:hypothetical protein
MVDTPRSRAALLDTLFADGQGASEITPQDMRDFIVSTYGTTGWAEYRDTEYSTGSPQAISADTWTVIENNAGSTRLQELPLDRPTGFYTAVGDKIVGYAGDGYSITADYIIRRTTGSGSFAITTAFNIGNITPIRLYARTELLAGTAEQFLTTTTGAYSLDTWVANGAKFEITSSVAAEVFGVRYVIHRHHRGQGTYP